MDIVLVSIVLGIVNVRILISVVEVRNVRWDKLVTHVGEKGIVYNPKIHVKEW